jgi:hypothetical protein
MLFVLILLVVLQTFTPGLWLLLGGEGLARIQGIWEALVPLGVALIP